MLKKVGFVFCLLVLAAFLAQNTFAATMSPIYNKNIFLLTPTPTPTPTPVASKAPSTGAPLLLEGLALSGLGLVGWKMRKTAKRFWA